MYTNARITKNVQDLRRVFNIITRQLWLYIKDADVLISAAVIVMYSGFGWFSASDDLKRSGKPQTLVIKKTGSLIPTI